MVLSHTGAKGITVEKIGNGGMLILPIQAKNKVTMITESVIVTFILPQSILNNSLNNFIENVESLKTQIGKNEILENIILVAKKQRMIIGSFLDNYKSINRTKRQIGLIAAGLASVVEFGVNEIRIEQINLVLTDIKKDNTHNEGRLNILENTIHMHCQIYIKHRKTTYNWS